MGPLTGKVWRLLALALTLASPVRADLVVIASGRARLV
jgi:hypothetical protein